MAQPFIGEIRLFANNFAPMGFVICAGQLMSIAQNPALYSILGITYGGDGRNTFGIPNLQGRSPIGNGHGPGLSTHYLGQMGGAAAVALQQHQLPQHNHDLKAVNANGTDAPGPQAYLARDAFKEENIFFLKSDVPSPSSQLDQATLGIEGSSSPHENRQPYLVLNYYMAEMGEYPQRN